MLMEYLQEEGEWKGMEVIGKNKDLGKLLDEMLNILSSPPKCLPGSGLSKLKLKLAVAGAPFSGRTSLARKLEDRFGIARIEVKNLISSAVEACDAGKSPDSCFAQQSESVDTQKHEDAKDPGLEQKLENSPVTEDMQLKQNQLSVGLQKIALGRKAKHALQQGLQVPDTIVVQLLMLSINSLVEQDSSIATQNLVLKGKDTPTFQDGQEMDNDNSVDQMGFVLDGYPDTAEQAEILEKALTGFDMKEMALNRTRTSLIAPPPVLEQVEKFSSGLDGIFMIDPLEEMEALKRAMGKRVDPKTGLMYNLEFDPPPQNDKTWITCESVGHWADSLEVFKDKTNSRGISSRLVQVEEVGLVRKRIKEGTRNWTSLLEWMNNFKNVYFIGRTEHGNMNFDVPVSIAEGFLDARAKAASAENAAKAAIDADKAANKALHDAERASLEASEAAKHFFLAKVAELEASAMLDRTSANSTAKDLLKGKASELANQKFQDATAALKEAEDAAETAKLASIEAHNAANTAQHALKEASAVFQAEAEAMKAAEKAKAAALSAHVACQKAETASKAAALSLSNANGSLETASTNPTENKISAPPNIIKVFCTIT
eukprot:Gb_19574 [translate_table: standard]